VDEVQPTGAQRAIDRPAVEPRPLELRAGDDSLLIVRDLANCPGSARFSVLIRGSSTIG
jgi:hypothetical protein